jgi:hypothetical protein
VCQAGAGFGYTKPCLLQLFSSFLGTVSSTQITMLVNKTIHESRNIPCSLLELDLELYDLHHIIVDVTSLVVSHVFM